jgi:hypothetical protein
MDLNAQAVSSVPKAQIGQIVQQTRDLEQHLIHLGQAQDTPFPKLNSACNTPLDLSKAAQ